MKEEEIDKLVKDRIKESYNLNIYSYENINLDDFFSQDGTLLKLTNNPFEKYKNKKINYFDKLFVKFFSEKCNFKKTVINLIFFRYKFLFLKKDKKTHFFQEKITYIKFLYYKLKYENIIKRYLFGISIKDESKTIHESLFLKNIMVKSYKMGFFKEKMKKLIDFGNNGSYQKDFDEITHNDLK